MYPDFLYQNYSGKYVATERFDDFNVIASGETIESTLEQALTNGIDKPVIFYVPEKNIINIYHVNN